MQLTEMFLDQLEHEVKLSRKVLEQVPEGKYEWRPHEKSMMLGYLAALVATMPSWAAIMLELDELDVAKPSGRAAEFRPKELRTREQLLRALDDGAADARRVLAGTTDAYLMTNWRFLIAGRVIEDKPRYLSLRDSVFGHLAHHRGQLTVYLRLNGALVPALYGPSADESV
jgi:uncharacterized damage-inducible protein DinB